MVRPLTGQRRRRRNASRSLYFLSALVLAAAYPVCAAASRASLAATATSAAGQSAPTYIPLAPAKGALYKPDTGPAPHVAVLLIHRTANFLSHPAATELARRGFLVLAMNPRSDNNEAAVDFEKNALDIKAGIEFLRRQPDITKVILFGHSGGGPATSFYQAVAEKGVAYCEGATKLVECDDTLAGLPRADGLVLVDAHPGVSINGLRSLNPAVLDEHDPRTIDPALDPYNPANGYDPKAPHYSEAFQQKYFKAQAARMNRLIDAALARLAQMKAGRDPYPDDDVFTIVRGKGARLMEIDPHIEPRTLHPQKLLANDGTIKTQIIETVRPVGRTTEASNRAFSSGTRLLTIRSFLSANAIRANDSMEDIDWCSSNNSTRCAVRNITIPLLVTAMGAHYFIRDSEIHYESAASQDKDFIVIEGATHGIQPCKACEKRPGQYGNSVRNFFDYVQHWINARF
jgi:pimeloyl-ACP methyl ester carboxylesterase